jgi:hypothetical protein
MNSSLKSQYRKKNSLFSPFVPYDELNDGVEPGLRVKKYVTGIHWAAIQFEGIGLALSPVGGTYP